MPAGAARFVHPSVNGAHLGVRGCGFDLSHNPLAERGDLLLGFGHQSREPAPDSGAMWDALETQRPAQPLILRQQYVQLYVTEGARCEGDDGEQQKGLRGEVTLLAARERRGQWLLIVFLHLLD